MNDARSFAVAFICVIVGIGLGVAASYSSMDKPENKPYALKQNGDTLFIPTQVVVKHDTLVVIVTNERRPIQDSIDAAKWAYGEGAIYIGSGSWTIERGPLEPKPYKQRDTIYEHKIIYY